MFITDRTGWTPEQISKLTVRQLNLYVEAWNKLLSPKTESRENVSPTVEELRAFNLAAGIQRVKKK